MYEHSFISTTHYRECSLFSEDGEYVIVGSASFIPEEHHPPMHQLHRNNESVAPNPRNPLEDYTLYAIEIAEGIITDTVVFKTDKIFLSHNQGLYLYRDFVAVLSVQHQTIHLFKFQGPCLKLMLIMIFYSISSLPVVWSLLWSSHTSTALGGVRRMEQ